IHQLSEVKKLLGQLMLQHVLGFQLKVGIQFNLFRLQLQLLMMLVIKEMMEEEVKSLCCLFVEMLCLGLQLLKVLISFRTHRL
ncbi:hypothetical protein, partial [Winogradskyella ouciana]|uniref:hypothetical protein n=1 Tax=Winogradskyella ouciana TaxID=2608631 RepID=UPI001F1B63EF